MRPELRSVLLAVLILVSALAVVYVRHEGRRGFVELTSLEQERDDLVTDWGRLQIEYATWAEGSRIESLARERLGLVERADVEVMEVQR